MAENPYHIGAGSCWGEDFCPILTDLDAKRHCLYDLLLRISDLVVTSRSGVDLVKDLAPTLENIFRSEFLELSLHDPRQNCFITRYWKDGESGELKPRTLEDSVIGHVWTNQKPLVLADITREQRFGACLEELRALGVKTYAILPLSTLLGRYGTIGLGNGDSRVLPAEGVQLFSRIARMIALCFENQERLRAWEEQQDRLQGLLRISQELSVTLDPEKLAPILLHNLPRLVHYDVMVLGLLDQDGNTLQMQAVDAPGWQPSWEGDWRMPVVEAPSAQAIATRSIVFQAAVDLEKLDTPFANALRSGGIQSLCSVPLCSSSTVWGALNVGSARKEAFSRQDGAFLQQVANQITAVLENARAYREIAKLKDRLASEKRYLENEIRSEMHWDEIIGASAALKRVLDSAAVVARTDATVLITGETGTGKERVARAIHAMGQRSQRSFIKLNCAAIPTGLLESELFGHEKGAFTGAISQKIGRLELANKGTLFLDEIGDIPIELQPKLLRVLQDYEFERLGGTRTIHVDVRLIAATNRDLVRAVDEKQFRRDLFYRLHVFPLHLPALRERREDIPLLVRYFVEKCSWRFNKRIDIIPDEAIEAMMKWKWPGNIRELENFIERSVILSEGNVLHAPLIELQQDVAHWAATSDDTLRGREREHIIQILRQTRGMLSGASGAAARLGMKRTTLQYRMQKLGISRLDYLD